MAATRPRRTPKAVRRNDSSDEDEVELNVGEAKTTSRGSHKRARDDSEEDDLEDDEHDQGLRKQKLNALRLDAAVAKAESMEGWSEARKIAWAKRDTAPNTYYFRFNAPGEKQKTGPWSDVREHSCFFSDQTCLATHELISDLAG